VLAVINIYLGSAILCERACKALFNMIRSSKKNIIGEKLVPGTAPGDIKDDEDRLRTTPRYEHTQSVDNIRLQWRLLA
jgi:hypothetical protein